MMKLDELVVCAAVKFTYDTEEGSKSVVLAGVRHHAILQSEIAQEIMNRAKRVVREEGFLTNKYNPETREYRFVERRVAKAILECNEQKVNPRPEHHNGTNYLFSEDLY